MTTQFTREQNPGSTTEGDRVRVIREGVASYLPDIDAEDFFDRPPLKQFRGEQVSHWHRRLGRWFDIGTLYTMLAGMLNVLVIYDAWAGPLGTPTDADRKARTTPQPKT